MLREIDSYCPECLCKTILRCTEDDNKVCCDICHAIIDSGASIGVDPYVGENGIEDAVTLEKITHQIERLEDHNRKSLTNIRSMIDVYQKIQRRESQDAKAEREFSERD